MSSLYVAWRYLGYNRVRTCILVACVSIILALPLALDVLLDLAEEHLVSRARSTPLIVGAKGSALDLTMNAVYFGDQMPELISMAEEQEVRDSGLGLAVPVYSKFRARGHPIVGTSLEYFELRGLEVARGRNLALLGECVLGAAVARQLGLGPGDSLTSSPESVFDLGGVYPLKMTVVGVLAPTQGPDDRAIFVDVKTAWVIEGIGHGHRALSGAGDQSVVLERSATSVKANARLLKYNEVTRENMHTFHFHGAPVLYPLTAVIVAPEDERSGTLLRGRYLADDAREQIVSPLAVVRELLERAFSIKQMLDATMALVSVAAILAIALVFALSLRLREQEIRTVFRLGGSRTAMAGFVGAEVAIIVVLAGVFCAAVLATVSLYGMELARTLMLRHAG